MINLVVDAVIVGVTEIVKCPRTFWKVKMSDKLHSTAGTRWYRFRVLVIHLFSAFMFVEVHALQAQAQGQGRNCNISQTDLASML